MGLIPCGVAIAVPVTVVVGVVPPSGERGTAGTFREAFDGLTETDKMRTTSGVSPDTDAHR
jgi:hypothetical protein